MTHLFTGGFVFTFSHEDLFSLINPILSHSTSVYRRLAGEAEHESEAWPHHPRHPRVICRHELSKLSSLQSWNFKHSMGARN
jgi:hypothetical protein